MRFMVSMIGDGSMAERMSPEEMQEMGAAMKRLNDELEEAGVVVGAGRLGPSAEARTLRYGEDGQVVVTDGPFAETKEQLAGYWIFECDSIEDAVQWASKAPAAGRAMEVRPLA
jgi:hypothetical protein